MLAKYTIEFTPQLHQHTQLNHYSTDDPVTCEQFVSELLERGFAIKAIRHEGIDLVGSEFDRIVRVAAGMLAARHICASLHISAEEERHRFGFAL